MRVPNPRLAEVTVISEPFLKSEHMPAAQIQALLKTLQAEVPPKKASRIWSDWKLLFSFMVLINCGAQK